MRWRQLFARSLARSLARRHNRSEKNDQVGAQTIGARATNNSAGGRIQFAKLHQFAIESRPASASVCARACLTAGGGAQSN